MIGRAKLLSGLCWGLCLFGCVQAPLVQPIPEVMQSAAQAGDGDGDRGGDAQRSVSVDGWWLPLEDDVLDELITLGLSGNPDAQIALQRLVQAERGLQFAQASRWPAISATGSRDVRKFSGPAPTDTRSDLGALSLSWDAGLWGKRRLEVAQAQQFRDQRWFEHQAARLSLSATIAETYFAIVELAAQSELLSRQVQVSLDLERLIEARFRLGQAPASDVYQQREATTALQQQKLGNDTELVAREASLDVLIGTPVDGLNRVDRRSVPAAPELTDAGTVDDLVRFRADILAASEAACCKRA